MPDHGVAFKHGAIHDISLVDEDEIKNLILVAVLQQQVRARNFNKAANGHPTLRTTVDSELIVSWSSTPLSGSDVSVGTLIKEKVFASITSDIKCATSMGGKPWSFIMAKDG